jgi:hypothetical protein
MTSTEGDSQAPENQESARAEQELRDRMTNLIVGVSEYYAGRTPSSSTGPTRNAYAKHRMVSGTSFQDGTHRAVVHDTKASTTETTFRMPPAFTDWLGRPVIMVATEDAQGRVVGRELRFQPRSDVPGQLNTHYRLVPDAPTALMVHGGHDWPLDTSDEMRPVFDEARKLVDHVAGQWELLQQGLIQAPPPGAGIFGGEFGR